MKLSLFGTALVPCLRYALETSEAAAFREPVPAVRGPVIDGEQFSARVMPDQQQGGMPVGVIAVPEKWRFSSQVDWNYGQISNPVSISASAENPVNDEAFIAYPELKFFTLRPLIAGFYRPGQNVGGLIFAEPQPPLQTLITFVQQARCGASKLRWIGSKTLPDLPAALRMPASPNLQGIGVKIAYEIQGKPMEEEFYAVFYSVDIPYDGPQGRTWQINWGLSSLHSFRAPADTLERRRPVFAALAKSFRPNPAWQQRLMAINTYLADQFNRQLQAGYDVIAAAGRLSAQISANNDAMIASIDRQLQALHYSDAGLAMRSSVEKFDDYIRGVDTINDPYYGTSQHSSMEQYHWTDGYGSYRNSNEAAYNPNQAETGNWQLMQPTR